MRQTFCSRIAGPAALVCAATWAFATPSQAADFKILQPLHDKPKHMKKGALPWDGYYVPSTPDTVMWGSLPNANTKPVLSVPSGNVVTFDTVSHEGVLEDQGKDPVKYFGQFGVKPEQVLKDAQAIAASSLEHDFVKDGPPVATGRVEVKGGKDKLERTRGVRREPRREGSGGGGGTLYSGASGRCAVLRFGPAFRTG